MPLAKFGPAIPAGERPQTHVFDRAVTGTRMELQYGTLYSSRITQDHLRVHENRQYIYIYTMFFHAMFSSNKTLVCVSVHEMKSFRCHKCECIV